MIQAFNGSAKEWNDLVYAGNDLSLMQLYEYAEAKKEMDGWKVERYIVFYEDKIVMAFQALLKILPVVKRGLVFINRPVYFNHDKKNILFALQEIKEFWNDKRKMYLLADLNLHENIFTQEELSKIGFSQKNESTVGWATDIVDLSVSEEDLRKNLKQKWRNCLNKADKMMVETQHGSSSELLHKFLNDYKTLIHEIGFKPGVKPEFIEKLFELAGNKEKYQVITATCEGKEVGSVLIPFYGDYALYLASGAHSAGKQMNVTYKLLWEAVLLAKRKGLKYFDLGGVNEVTTPKGILHFKQGLSGVPNQFLPLQKAYKKGILNTIIERKLQNIE